MRVKSLTLLSVSLITFVSAIPTPDKYIHHKEPGCPAIAAFACNSVTYCQHHHKRRDLFAARSLESRDAPGPGNLDLNLTHALSPSLPSLFTTRELNVNWKRTGPSVVCASLSSPVGREVSARFITLAAGVLYDLIIDYPYNGATRGVIGVFAKLFFVGGGSRIVRLASAPTANGGVRCIFRGHADAIWYQVVFEGANRATAAVNFYIGEH